MSDSEKENSHVVSDSRLLESRQMPNKDSSASLLCGGASAQAETEALPMTEEQRIASWGPWGGLAHHPWCNYSAKPLGEMHCNCQVGARLYRGKVAQQMLNSLSAHIEKELGQEFIEARDEVYADGNSGLHAMISGAVNRLREKIGSGNPATPAISDATHRSEAK